MIRKAKIEDKEQIVRLYKQLHRYHCQIAPHRHIMPREEFFEERVSEILADGSSVILINDDKTVNAYALFKIIEVSGEEKVPRRVCFIDCFGVDESARHKGIGRKLFEGVKEYARETGCNAVQLDVNAENENAKAFYEKIGLMPRSIIMAQNI